MIELKKGVLLLSFEKKEKLSFVNTPFFKEKLKNLLKTNLKGVVLNCKNLEFIDSTGISVIVSFIKTLSKRGGWLKICEVNHDVKQIFEMIKLNKLAEIVETEQEVLERLQVAWISVSQ